MQQANHALSKKKGMEKFLAFDINGHGFGIPIEWVREIVYHSEINPLPQTPQFVRGIAMVRNESTPVLDLNILLGGERHTRIHHESCFIVLQLADHEGQMVRVCLLADQILHTYKIDSTSIDEPPTINEKTVVNYIIGVARVADQIFVILDPVELIAPFMERIPPYISYNDSGINATCNNADIDTNKKSEEKQHKYNNKFLSVFIDDDEYAFPLSLVSQVIKRTGLVDLIESDIPEFLHAAVVHDNNPLGIICINDYISNTENETTNKQDQKLSNSQTHKPDSKYQVIVLIEIINGLLGIVVDRIGQTYEIDTSLKQNSFCTGLQRNRIKSLGFIEKPTGSIEVLDPVGLMTKKEQNVLQSWISCIDRMIDISESDNISFDSASDSINPVAHLAGSYLVVAVGDKVVGLNNHDVEEVLTYSNLIPLKSGPNWFPGLLDLRKNTYPVIDLRVKLDIEAIPPNGSERKVLVMMNYGDEKFGLMVDRIINSSHISIEHLRGAEHSQLWVNPEAIHAVAELNDNLIHIINLQYMVSENEISARRLVEEMRQQAENIESTTPSVV